MKLKRFCLSLVYSLNKEGGDNTVGWRAKLGFLVPSVNVVLEPEVYKMIPEGVSAHFARMRITKVTEDQLKALADVYMPKAVEGLADAKVDVIAFGCTGGSLIKGIGHDQEIISAIEKSTGIPATTTSTAVIKALNEMGIKKVSVATPYEEWLNLKEKKFLEGNGFKVMSIKGLGVTVDPEKIPKVHPEAVYELAREVNMPEADGIFISCTDFRTIEVLDALETDLDKPVISSNQSTVWMTLRMAGVNESIKGFGQLLTK